MSDDLIKKYQELKTKKEQLSTQLTSEEASFKTLREQYNNDLKDACAKYSVASLDELLELAKKIEAELNALIESASSVIKVLQGSDLNLEELSWQF